MRTFISLLLLWCLGPVALHAQDYPIGGPYEPDSATVLLLHFNGDFVNDSDVSVHTERYGNTAFVTQSPIVGGAQSVYFDNDSPTDSSFLIVPEHSALDLDGSWTIEAWINVFTYGQTSDDHRWNPGILMKPGDTHLWQANYSIQASGSGRLLHTGYYHPPGDSLVDIISSEDVIPPGHWYHISFIRDTTHHLIALAVHDENQNPIYSSVNTYDPHTESPPLVSERPLYFAQIPGSSNAWFDGFMDEVRISNVVRDFFYMLPPTLFASQIDSGTVELTWGQQPFTPSVYRIYRSTDNLHYTLVDSTSGNPPDTSYTDTGLDNGTRYYYKITSVLYPYAESAFSNVISAMPNAAPVLSEVSDQTIQENTTLKIALDASDPDGDAIEFAVFTDESAVAGEVTNDTLTLTPVEYWSGETAIQVVARDYSLSDTIEFTLTVTPNAAPVLTPIPDQSVLEDSLVQISVSASDPENNDLTFTVITQEPEVIGTISDTLLTLTPQENWYGTSTIQVIAQDYHLSDTATFELTSIPVNDQPVAKAITEAIGEGDTLAIGLLGSPGPDNESQQVLTYVITSLPEEGVLSAANTDGAIQGHQLPYALPSDTVYFSPTRRFAETHFHYQVKDNGGTEYGAEDTSEDQPVTITLTLTPVFAMTTSGPVESGITYFDSDELYAASSGDGVYRFDTTGSVLYTLKVDGDVKSSTTVTPMRDIYIASTDYNLYSFNSNGLSNTGWPISLGAEVTASVAVNQSGMLYIGTSNGIFQAIDPHGEVQWGFNMGAPVYASAAISQENTLYIVNENGRVFSFDLGHINPDHVQYKWMHEIGESVVTSPALDGEGNLYMTTMEGTLLKLYDAGSEAQVAWQYTMHSPIESSPIIGSDYGIYFGGTDSTMYKVDTTGTLIWNTPVGSAVRSTAAVANFSTNADRLYVGTDEGILYALATETGEKVWQYETQSSIRGPILFAGKTVYAGTHDGHVVAIEEQAVQSGVMKNTAVHPVWHTFQGNNARTGKFGEAMTDVESSTALPANYTLLQNYPNPFNPSTTIRYGLPAASQVQVTVYDVRGEQVATLIAEQQSAGWHSVQWDGRNEIGRQVSTGVYFYRLVAEDFVETKKMVLMK